jgi:hypothetical protein
MEPIGNIKKSNTPTFPKKEKKNLGTLVACCFTSLATTKINYLCFFSIFGLDFWPMGIYFDPSINLLGAWGCALQSL